jgi:hypothetical protein
MAVAKRRGCCARRGLAISRKRVVRLQRLMGMEARCAKPRTSLLGPSH